MDPEEEIRRLQEARKKQASQTTTVGGRVKFGEAGGFDDEIYGGAASKEAFDFVEFNQQEGDDDNAKEGEKEGEGREEKVRTTGAGAQLEFFEEVRSVGAADKEAQDEIQRRARSKILADREGEYQRRWRKRQLSPPHSSQQSASTDKKKGTAATTSVSSAVGSSYKERMKQVIAEKEQWEQQQLAKKMQKRTEEERNGVKREVVDEPKTRINPSQSTPASTAPQQQQQPEGKCKQCKESLNANEKAGLCSKCTASDKHPKKEDSHHHHHHSHHHSHHH